MKSLQTLTLLIILLSICSSAQSNFNNKQQDKETNTSLPKVANQSFKRGEKLEYRIHYGVVDAGTATLEVLQEKKQIAGRETYHIVGTGKSNRFFDFFFKVRDTYESYIDTEGLFPWFFKRRVNEGGYKIEQDYVFNQEKRLVKTNKGETYEVPIGIQDMVSAFYHARTKNYANLKLGDVIKIETFIDNEIWTAGMKFLGTDTIKVETGTYSCLKFAPVVQKGRIFKNEEDMVVWVSNDENKIPIHARAKILVGSIKMDLVEYSNLANPIAKLD